MFSFSEKATNIQIFKVLSNIYSYTLFRYCYSLAYTLSVSSCYFQLIYKVGLYLLLFLHLITDTHTLCTYIIECPTNNEPCRESQDIFLKREGVR